MNPRLIGSSVSLPLQITAGFSFCKKTPNTQRMMGGMIEKEDQYSGYFAVSSATPALTAGTAASP